MIETVEAQSGGYRFMPGVSQYSCGIGALPGFAIERVRFSKVVPLKQGFEKIAEIIAREIIEDLTPKRRTSRI